MATSELKIVVNAEDNASSKIKGITGSLENMKPVFAGMAAAGTVAFGAITAYATSAVKAAAGAESAQKQLEHAVLNVSKATKQQLDATSALADELQAKGVLDGDNIKLGLAQLSTFGLSNKAVQALGGSLADLAVNQFGVNASGDQLTQTANVMAKALQGQFGVLEKSGIRFTEAQQKIILYGTEMEKVKAINEGFAQNLKLTNEVALKTTEGQIAKVTTRLGDMHEAIGAALIPIVLQLIEKITPLVETMVAWATANPELIKTLLIVGAALAAIVAVVGTLGLVIPALIAGFAFLGSTAAIVIGIIAGLALVFYNVYKITQLLLTSLPEIIAGIKAYWLDFLNWANESFLKPFKQYWSDVWLGIKTMAKEAIDSVVGWLSPIISMLDSVLSKIASVTSGVAKGVSGAWNAAVNVGANIISGTRAGGGNVSGGSSYLVGENGPEIFTPAMSGSIAANGGGGITVNINGGTYLSETVARDIGDKIVSQFKRLVR